VPLLGLLAEPGGRLDLALDAFPPIAEECLDRLAGRDVEHHREKHHVEHAIEEDAGPFFASSGQSDTGRQEASGE
jgi:hypothetical protein